jgi:hypothetical protein
MPRRDIKPNNRTSLASRLKSLLRRPAASAPTQYKYSPLNKGAREIRLMTLFPGTVSSEIRVSLEIVPFTRDDVYDFEALSYAWGTAENPTEIFIGASGHQVLSVTQNLAEALPYLRYEDRSRVLWIDAICVNQQDLKERSRQVERMADIFTKASRVVVWLGPESSDSSVAMDCFHTISENIQVHPVMKTIRSLSNETHWEDIYFRLPSSRAQYWSMYRFLQRSWFERLGSRNTAVKCGAKEIPWSSICTAGACLYAKAKHPEFLTPELLSSVERVNALCNTERETQFVELIKNTQRCLCSDPKDRVFAILSLVQPPNSELLNIKPDYSKSVHEIYTETAIHYFEQYKSLDLLRMVEEHNQSQNLPSWVPDFRCPHLAFRLGGPIMSAGRSQPAMKIVKKQRLRITGVHVATIARIEGLENLQETPGYYALGGDFKNIASTLLGKESYTHDEQHFEAFCRTICTNRLCEKFDPPKTNFPSMKQCKNVVSDVLDRGFSSGELSDDRDRQKVSNEMVVSIQGRSVFKTIEGNFGLAPKAAMAGDVVVVLLGCRAAMIFRPSRNNTYRVIGEAYIHGFMECQAFLGPLPDPFEYILHYYGPYKTGWAVCFNRKTGLVQVEDPRFGPLPDHVRAMPVFY